MELQPVISDNYFRDCNSSQCAVIIASELHGLIFTRNSILRTWPAAFSLMHRQGRRVTNSHAAIASENTGKYIGNSKVVIFSGNKGGIGGWVVRIAFPTLSYFIVLYSYFIPHHDCIHRMYNYIHFLKVTTARAQVHLTASAPSRNQAELQQFHNSYEARQMSMRKRSMTTLSDTNNGTQAGSTDHRNDSTSHVRTRRLFWGVSSFRCRRRMINALTLGRRRVRKHLRHTSTSQRWCVYHRS